MAASNSPKEIDCIENIFEKYLPTEELAEVKRILYGKELPKIALAQESLELAEKYDFQLSGYTFNATKESLRPPQIVRVGLIQNQIVRPTTDDVADQRDALFERIEKIIDAAALSGVNIVCLQEAWTMPFAFCTREKQPWCEFAEAADESGASTKFLSLLAKKYGMVIISPILEREDSKGGILWNTSVVISHTGKVIGKFHSFTKVCFFSTTHPLSSGHFAV